MEAKDSNIDGKEERKKARLRRRKGSESLDDGPGSPVWLGVGSRAAWILAGTHLAS